MPGLSFNSFIISEVFSSSSLSLLATFPPIYAGTNSGHDVLGFFAFGDEDQGGTIDAVPHAGGCAEAVVEDVPEVAVAAGAAHLGADHAEGGVFVLGDRAFCDLLIEAGPAAAGVELVLHVVEVLSAARAVEGAFDR